MIKSLITGLLIFTLWVPSGYAQSTDFTGFKFFINPGHGGYDSNDRHMLTTDFWESEGNLEKALFLRELLENLNATVYLSRTTNTTADDLSLSVIDEMANAVQVDFFLSIHSNGSNGTQNLPLVLFRGYDDQPVFPEAKEIAAILWQKIYEKGNCWTHSNPSVRGDWSFYPEWGDQAGLGILRTLAMPGVLSEGSFHDYIPESWRLRNANHLHHESWAMLRSLTEFYDITPANLGIIAGTIRDTFQTPPWYFKKGTPDEKMPVNGAKVTLNPGNRICLVDSLNNGLFFFDSLAPGEYQLHFQGMKDYYDDSLWVEVAGNQTTLADIYVKKDTTRIPEIIIESDSSAVTFYPNPVKGEGTIQYTLGDISHVSVSVYRSDGRKIEDLFEANLNKGEQKIKWEPSDYLPTGLYIIRMDIKSLKDGTRRTVVGKWLRVK
jgi:N-acetylmuramoyl-L-alanine amidase